MKVLLFVFGLFVTACPHAETTLKTTLKINGSSTVNPVVADSAEIFRKRGWKVLVDTQGGSSGGISYLAEGMCDLGMSSRPISEKDRKKYPKTDFVTHEIGFDGVALVVSKDLYNSGIKSLTKDQITKIYEGKIKNWQKVGGPNRPIVFFNKEPGRGTWEVFAKFLYGKAKNAPKVFHPEVGANQEARTKVANHKGGITQLSASWAWDHDKVRAVAIGHKSKAIPANLKNIESGIYPMRRPLLVLTNGPAKGATKEFIAYLRSAQGQKTVKKHGYLSLSSNKGS